MIPTKIIISFIIFSVIFLPLVASSGESINFQYPSQVTSGQAYSTSLDLVNFSSDIYDVKIDVFNSGNGRISQIFNGGTLRSTFYYVIGAINTSINNSGSFNLNITQNYEGVATVNITVRGSATYKFGPYSLNVAESIETINQSTELNQTQNQTGQNQSETVVPQNQTANCLGVQFAKITGHPSEMIFGGLDKVLVTLNVSCYGKSYARMLVYGSSSRIIAYGNGTKITSYASCQQGSEFANLTSKDYSFDLPFYVYPNCDSKYESGNYSVSLRICDSNGNNYYDESFYLNLSGINASVCVNQTSDVSNENSTEVLEANNEVTSLPQSKSIQLSGNEDSSGDKKSEIVYRSTEIKSVTIAAYLAGILFLLLCAYLIVHKGKI